MKRTRAFLPAAICMLVLAGCGQLPQEAKRSDVSVVQPTAAATPDVVTESSPILTPFPESTATLPPDIEENARFYADLDGDGEDEAIVISSVGNDNPEENDNISLGVFSKKAYRQVHVQEGFFSNAFLTRTPSGDVCIMIGCQNWVGIDEYTTVCSFNGLMPVLHESICSWIVEVDGAHVILGNWADFIGSWNYTCVYELTDGFELLMVSDVMISMENNEPLHTIRELPVEMMKDGEYVADTVPTDTYLWPVSSDGEGRMTFRLEDGKEGRITYTRNESYEAVIGGVNENEYFDNVEYWG